MSASNGAQTLLQRDHHRLRIGRRHRVDHREDEVPGRPLRLGRAVDAVGGVLGGAGRPVVEQGVAQVEGVGQPIRTRYLPRLGQPRFDRDAIRRDADELVVEEEHRPDRHVVDRDRRIELEASASARLMPDRAAALRLRLLRPRRLDKRSHAPAAEHERSPARPPKAPAWRRRRRLRRHSAHWRAASASSGGEKRVRGRNSLLIGLAPFPLSTATAGGGSTTAGATVVDVGPARACRQRCRCRNA